MAPRGKLPLSAWMAAAACSMLCSCTSAPLPLYSSVLGNLQQASSSREQWEGLASVRCHGWKRAAQ